MTLKPGLTQATFFRHAIIRDAMPETVDAMQGDTVLHEVWLMDTGHFVVLRDVPPEYRNGRGWVRLMRQRRTLRMFLPESEIAKLPAIETTFHVAKRGFEIRDLIDRLRKRGGLGGTYSLDDLQEGVLIRENHADRVRIVQRYLRDALNALRGIAQHTDLFPPEVTTSVRTAPYDPPEPVKPPPEDKAKKGETGKPKPGKKGP